MARLQAEARLAGVSAAAVSRTFTAGASVSPAMRIRVETAAQQLGYSPNVLARSLTTRQTRMVGLVSDNFRNPVFLQVLDLFTRGLQDRGSRPVLVNRSGGDGPGRLAADVEAVFGGWGDCGVVHGAHKVCAGPTAIGSAAHQCFRADSGGTYGGFHRDRQQDRGKLTTFHQPVGDIIAAVEVMADLLTNPNHTPQARIFPCTPVERGTLRRVWCGMKSTGLSDSVTCWSKEIPGDPKPTWLAGLGIPGPDPTAVLTDFFEEIVTDPSKGPIRSFQKLRPNRKDAPFKGHHALAEHRRAGVEPFSICLAGGRHRMNRRH